MASFRICFLFVVSGIHDKIVKIRHCFSCSCSAGCRGSCKSPGDDACFLVSWRKLTWGRGFLCPELEQALNENMAQRKWTGQSRWWEEHFLRNLTSSYPFYHYEIYDLKKCLDAFSFWGKKGAFYCIKRRLLYFGTPLFEPLSSAGGSQIPLTRSPACWWERFLGGLSCPREEAGSLRPGTVERSTCRNTFWSRFHFCSLLKTNIHQ